MNPLFLAELARFTNDPLRLHLALGVPLKGTRVYLLDGMVYFLDGWEYGLKKIGTECWFCRVESDLREECLYVTFHGCDAPDLWAVKVEYWKRNVGTRIRESNLRSDRVIGYLLEHLGEFKIPLFRDTLSLLEKKLHLPPRWRE